MKKITAIISLIAFLLVPFSAFGQETENKLDFVEAKSVVLMCLDTGEVLYAENEYEHLSPASVTKIMTILLVLEALDTGKITLNDEVSAGAEAVSMGGSQIWLEQGEVMTVDELLKAVVVASANDACTALGEYIAGSHGEFVKMMNERAKELGCENTNFENCNGLDDTVTNHYSCAYDLALISREVMKHALVENYTSIWLDSLRDGKTELNNTNKLVNTYNGITGLKTGTTSNAGFCISATARRDNMNLCAVVLGSETSDKRFDTAAALLDWGFANFELAQPSFDDNAITPVKVVMGDIKQVKPIYGDVSVITVKKGSGSFSYNYNIHKKTEAPVSKGDSLGHIDIIGEEGLITSIDLISPVDISKISLKSVFFKMLKNI